MRRGPAWGEGDPALQGPAEGGPLHCRVPGMGGPRHALRGPAEGIRRPPPGRQTGPLGAGQLHTLTRHFSSDGPMFVTFQATHTGVLVAALQEARRSGEGLLA